MQLFQCLGANAFRRRTHGTLVDDDGPRLRQISHGIVNKPANRGSVVHTVGKLFAKTHHGIVGIEHEHSRRRHRRLLRVKRDPKNVRCKLADHGTRADRQRRTRDDGKPKPI